MRNRKHTRFPQSLSSFLTKPHPQPLSFGGEGSNFVSSPSSEHPRSRWGRPGDNRKNPNRGIVSSPSSEGDGGGAASKKLKAFPATGWTRSQYSLGFTLVELIVVVTILAILATIGFVSYSSYLTGVRDTNRIAQMTSLSDGLNLYSTRNDLPIPEDNVEVSVSGNLIAYQGKVGANVLETINFEKGGVDPKDNTYFSYYLTSDRKYFQLMGFLEESADLTTLIPNPSPLEEKGASIVSLSPKGAPSLSLGQTQGIQGGGLFGLGRGIAQAANYQNRIPTVIGKKLGILTDLENTPIEDLGVDLDLGPTSDNMKGYIDNNRAITGASTDSFLQYHGNVAKSGGVGGSCKILIDRKKSLEGKNDIYMIAPDGYKPFPIYCDMSISDGGWSLIGSRYASGSGVKFNIGDGLVTKGSQSNVYITADAFRNSLTQLLACSSTNCWLWEMPKAYIECMETTCGNGSPGSIFEDGVLRNVFGEGNDMTVDVSRYNFSNDGNYMFRIWELGTSNGIGARTNLHNMNGVGEKTTWASEDKWDIYVR